MKRIISIPSYILITVLLLSLSSCQKDRVTLLTDGVWQFENITTNSENETIKTIVAGFKAVYTDGTMQFFSDGTYIKEFPLIVDETGNWELVGKTQLVFTPDGGLVQTASIDKISKSELVYLETFVEGDQNTFTTSTTWVK
ncbi:MAG: lipocalin family protein [Bacteroidales bacterium]|nr:lipocalin family protein [Bacteroidales bacterium]